MRAGRIYESAAERGVRRGRAFYAPNAVSGGEFFRGTAGTREFIIKKLK